MGFYEVSLLRGDTAFLDRVSACYASETPFGEGEDPGLWATRHSWDMASAPGFGDAYASAIAGGVENPGADASVITDNQILAAVQAIMNAEKPPVVEPTDFDPDGERQQPIRPDLDPGPGGDQQQPIRPDLDPGPGGDRPRDA